MADDNLINFPTINVKMVEPELRTIDEVDSWIEENYQLFFDRESYNRMRVKSSTFAQFRIID